MNLKWSYFNFLVESADKIKFLFNTYTNNLLKLNDDLFDALKQIEKSQNINELENILSKEEIEYFTKHSILVDNEEDLVNRLQFREYARIFSNKNIFLVIAPTQSCNFRCTYCIEDFNNVERAMSNETENSIIKFLQKQKEENGLKKIGIFWYGGEPLLAAKRMESLGLKIKSLNCEIWTNGIATNGYLLTDENIRILKSIGAELIQITIDGFKEIHDKRRILTTGKGTFDKIIGNIDNFTANKDNANFKLQIRVNVDKATIDDYIKIHQWLKDRYPQNNVSVYPGFVYSDGDSKNESLCLSSKEEHNFRMELYHKYGIVTERLFPNNLTFGCEAKNHNTMVIAPNGDIYKCNREFGFKEKIVGNINTPFIWTNGELRAKYTIGIDYFQDPQCRKCRYLPICNGGCPQARYLNKYENKNNNCCTHFKGRLKDYLELHYKIKVNKLAE